MTPSDSVREFVQTRFRNALRGRGVEPQDPLISTGVIDSFGVLEVIAFLEETFHVTIDPSQHELSEFETVQSMLALVRSSGGDLPE